MNSAQRLTLCLALVVVSFACFVSSEADDSSQDNVSKIRKKRQSFGVLQVIRFQNDACDASGSRNGTCYTAAECEDRGGSDDGTCADGFGVCCVFEIGCGGRSSENCTYFEESSVGDGSCRAEICPCGNDICQIRLDFDTFVITGPSTSSLSVFRTLNGQVTAIATAGINAALAGNCLTDTFSVTTNSGGVGPPTICGTNTGEHMYVDSSENCNDLVFNFGAGTSTTRNFRIKATQYACDSPLLAPKGCTQYFYGSSGSGIFQTYNFNSGNGYHLANQNQKTCFRRESGNCRQCFSAMATTDYQVSGAQPLAAIQGGVSSCCAYMANGQGIHGDCVVIQGLINVNGNPRNSKICGRGAARTRCTSTVPYMVRFMTDGFEVGGAANDEADGPNVGFRFAYWQDSTNCY